MRLTLGDLQISRALLSNVLDVYVERLGESFGLEVLGSGRLLALRTLHAGQESSSFGPLGLVLV